MSDPSPPPLPPTEAPRAFGARGWLAVCLIAVCVAVEVWSVHLAKAEKRPPAVLATPGAPAIPFEEEIQARYLVGMGLTLRSVAGEAAKSELHGALDTLRAEAKSGAARERLAIVEAEISSRSAGAAALAGVESPTAPILRKLYAGPEPERPTEAETAALMAAHGWLGELAATHGLADEAPARAEVRAEAQRSFAAVLAMGLVVMGALVVGGVLAVVALWMWKKGRLRSAFAQRWQPLVLPAGSVWLEAFAIYLTCMVAGGNVASLAGETWGPVVGGGAMVLAAVLALLWPRLNGLTRAERRAGWTWSGRGIWREMGAGVVGYFAGVPLIAVGMGLSAFLQRLAGGTDMSHPMVEAVGSPLPVLILLGFLAVVWAPVTEELVFRGAFHAAWRRRFGVLTSALGGALVFAAVHPQGWAAIPALGSVGVVLTLLREWRGSLVAPVTAHALNNGTLFVIMLLLLR